ncbi:hypothetical protein G6F32_016973 [Rhizopus arrhizus]|nr:hypothetical protein G6F32_016973 [Rhizopus arrhizus]
MASARSSTRTCRPMPTTLLAGTAAGPLPAADHSAGGGRTAGCQAPGAGICRQPADRNPDLRPDPGLGDRHPDRAAVHAGAGTRPDRRPPEPGTALRTPP